MMRMNMAAVGLMIAALTAGAGCASTRDGGMAGGASMKSSMPMSMSPAEMEVMASCKAMTHDAMMQNAKCKQMMKMHADMMKEGMMTK